MRDLSKYPVTLKEVVECLEKLMVDAMQEIEERQVCGDMTPVLIHKAIHIVKREQFFHGD